MKTKLSDYIVDFLVNQGVKHVFGITGGSIIHVMDSISKNSNLKLICTQHEQGAAIAADAYSRLNGNISVAISTSGPGATNLLTGTCCSYFDSIPVLTITGQEVRNQLKKDYKVRQIGFQETDVVSIFKPITKYSKLIQKPEDIRYELEKAIYLAKSGRPGPVLLDIPDDVQRAEINPLKLRKFIPEKKKTKSKLKKEIDYVLKQIKESKRPILILGNGIKLGKAESKAIKLVEKLKIPVALTWATKDIIPYNHPLVIEGFGTSANRTGNFAIQNSDLILSLGVRLNVRETGKLSNFGKKAKKIIVDIEQGELDKLKKRGMKVDLLINTDVNNFLDNILTRKIETKDISSWIKEIDKWKEKYPICLPGYYTQKNKVNPYVFMDALSQESKEGDIIITDAGGNLTWTMQGIRIKKNQKVFSAFNHSPMGYSLPASIGAYFSTKKPIICIIGDGGIQMNIQELATIKKHNLPIKIFLFNNHSYGIIQQTQDTWLNSNYVAVNSESGVAFPDFIKVSKAYGIPTITINNHNELKKGIRKTLNHKGPIFCNVEMKQHQEIMPKAIFGKPIEDSFPLLNRKEFEENMKK